MFWKTATGIGLVLFTWYVFGNNFQTSALTVVGEGKISVAPEELSLIVTKVNVSSDVVGAIDEGEKQIKTLTDIAKNFSGDTSPKIQKSFYRVTPQSSSQYLVANAFSFTTKNVSRVNDIIKGLYQAGATTVSDVSFTTSNSNQTDQQARVKAVEDAKMKAQDIAKSAGKHLGKLISIQDDNTTPNSSITSGINIDIVKRVSVVYEVW